MIKVLIVDDSAVMRKVLSEELAKFPDITILGTAADPYIAQDKIAKLHPDVIVLDLNMPRMDGLSFLGKIMKYNPLPVVIFSAFTPKNSEEAIKALELGAIEVISKPKISSTAPDIFRKLAHALRIAAFSRIRPNKIFSPQFFQEEKDTFPFSQDKVIAIGASTGGTKAIETVLMGLSSNVPGILIVQHMPENFTSAYAKRLNKVCPLEVREARDGDRVKPGLALIAPGNQHMLLAKLAQEYMVKLKDGPAVH
ncbi:MAG: response regulator, partial [Desulfobacterota bacterium]|nr:response regulator [Thermodesulfobacteriota bacterium]